MPSHTDVWEEKIHPGATLQVAQIMGGRDQITIEKAVRWEVRIRGGDGVQGSHPVCRM